uniref:Uncharacterized protein n=1 Tax=Salix viminalis TaxID=40686 RepID=A0A6N2MFP1_SALVM
MTSWSTAAVSLVPVSEYVSSNTVIRYGCGWQGACRTSGTCFIGSGAQPGMTDRVGDLLDTITLL